MENNQKIYIKAKDSDYLNNIIRKKDWQALIELASIKNSKNSLLFRYFQTDESKEVLKYLTEDQILSLIDYSQVEFANNVLDRMCSLCDFDEKYTNVALRLMKDVYGHGGQLSRSSIVKCLPLNVLKLIIDSRIPFGEFHFGPSKQEFFLYIQQTLSDNSKKNFDYKNLKENDTLNGVYIYILVECNNFPLERREVFKLVIQSFKESFQYIENNNSIDWKSCLINHIINPLYQLIIRALKDTCWDYKNDREIIDLLKSVFDEFHYSKFFRSSAAIPILNGRGNSSLLINADLLEQSKVIPRNYYYKVFKKAVQENKENFIDQVTRVFFTNCPLLKFVRELDDGIYKTLFNATIDMSVRELIERKRSENFAYCCRLLLYQFVDIGSFVPRYEECLLFIKSVISKFFRQKETLNVDVTSYPEICCYILNTLIGDPTATARNQNIDISYLIQKVNEKVHTGLDFIDDEMRNRLVLGVIRHPVDDTKFSNFITSNNPTTLVRYICYMRSVQDIKYVLPKSKRNTVDKYGFREGQSAGNPKENCKMNLVEMFLHTLKFWENHDKTLFIEGYISYYQFVRKILMEAISTKDTELKKAAIGVYYRYSELVTLMKNAKYIDLRISIASKTFLTPLAVIVGSELDKSFVENYIKKYIQPFNSHSYHYILSETISRSHIESDYDEDEEEIKSDLDTIFEKIAIDDQYATSTRILLSLIRDNAVKDFNIYCTGNISEDFFISNQRYINYIKSRFEMRNQMILSLCNPLATEYELPMSLNSPEIDQPDMNRPIYKLSPKVFLELSRFVGEESKRYTPNQFKTNLTKSLIKIQNIIKELTTNKYDTFEYIFTLDAPTIETSRQEYFAQSQYDIKVLYSPSFFDFLNEINNSQNHSSIFDSESYEIVKSAFLAQFLNEEDYLKQQNLPAPIFNGFDIRIRFRKHRNYQNIFNILSYKEKVDKYKFESYQKANELNNHLVNHIEKVYNQSKMIGGKTIDDVFAIDESVHRSRAKSPTSEPAKYRQNTHKCFTKIIDSLNKSKAESFYNDFDSLERLQNFKCIKKSGSTFESYSMLTQLFDLLINDFVSFKINLPKKFDNRDATTEDVYNFMLIVASVASPNLGPLNNLEKLTKITEKVATEKVPTRDPKLFKYIFKSGNVGQILTSMNSPLFSINASTFTDILLKKSGLLQSKAIINRVIDEVTNNKCEILDDFHVSLASAAIHPLLSGFPVPDANIAYLKKVAQGSLSMKRSACANAIYYSIMKWTSGQSVPLKDVIEIIESSLKKSPDEIIAFFCLLINKEASLAKMSQLRALTDLCNERSVPSHFVIKQGPVLQLAKEIGELYYSVIEKVLLAGLKSKKSHIYELTVTVLNAIKVGPEIESIISPFIVKGLKEIDPSEDNESFIKYATSFTMNNSDKSDCFDAYVETLGKLKKHSYAILRANAQINEDCPYPATFQKVENTYSNIIESIEKPYLDFKEEKEMISVTRFCKKLHPSLRNSRPAVGRDVFLRLESYASIFGDENVEEMVKSFQIDHKEESLSKFIVLVTHHEELVINIPASIESIYSKLKTSFTVKHTIELSNNLLDSQSKLRVSLQRAYRLASLLAPEVLSHMPDENDGNIVEILSNLGIFCRVNEVVPLKTIAEPASSPALSFRKKMLMKSEMSRRQEEPCEECIVEEFQAADVCYAVDADVDHDEVEIEFEEEGAVAGEDGIEEVDDGENQEDQIKDAFDIFS